MPYKSMDDVNPAIKGIKPPVTLAQANLIARWADRIEEANPNGNAWAMAIAAFKKSYVAKGGRWVKRTEKARWIDQYKIGDDGWMMLLPLGTFVRGNRMLPLTSELLESVLDNFLQGRPRWGVPITVEHEDGEGKMGKLAGMELRDEGLFGLPEWTDDGQELMDRRRFDFVSPEMLWSLFSGELVYQDHDTGEYHDNVMAAVSLTNKPFFPETALFTAGDRTEGFQTFTCECIECGHTMESEQHCADLKCPECGGQMRRKERPGPGQPGPEEGSMDVQFEGFMIDDWLALSDSLEELARGKPAPVDKPGVSNKSWQAVNKSQLPPSCFLIVGDRDHPTTWKLPYREADPSGGIYDEGPLKGRYKKAGPINAGAIRAILAALAGARTGKPMSVPAKVRQRVKAIAKRLGIGEPAEEGTMSEQVDQMAEGFFDRFKGWFEETFGEQMQAQEGQVATKDEFKVTAEEFEALQEQAGKVEGLTVALQAKDQMIQGLAERLDAAEEVAKAEKFKAVADSFKALPSTGETFATDLRTWAQKLGEEEWGKLRSLLSAADRGLAQSELFTERGSSRAGETDSFTALDKAIKARMEETKETYVDAAAWVSKNQSELMRAYYSE